MLEARAIIRSLPAYHPPLAGRKGLRLDFNENTVGCSPRMLERLRQMTSDDLARYPERHVAEARLAEFLEVGTNEVLLTNGVDEAIHLLCQTYLGPGDEALIVVPTYSMYRIYMMAAGAQVQELAANRDFTFPTDKLLQCITAETKLIAIANPNNPTGTLVPQSDLRRIATAAPSAAVLIDEAYFDFCGQTALSLTKDYPSVFVARTFSKAYGLAGLRLGALIGDERHIQTLRLACSPYNVNAIALACLPAALEDAEYVRNYVDDVLESRIRLEQFLEEQGVPFWPSEANFVLFRVGSRKRDAAALADRMRQKGILVRDRSSDYGCEGCVRVTLGLRQQTDYLLDVLRRTIDELRIPQGVAGL